MARVGQKILKVEVYKRVVGTTVKVTTYGPIVTGGEKREWVYTWLLADAPEEIRKLVNKRKPSPLVTVVNEEVPC